MDILLVPSPSTHKEATVGRQEGKYLNRLLSLANSLTGEI